MPQNELLNKLIGKWKESNLVDNFHVSDAIMFSEGGVIERGFDVRLIERFRYGGTRV